MGTNRYVSALNLATINNKLSDSLKTAYIKVVVQHLFPTNQISQQSRHFLPRDCM
jgi:hypothetical protein